MLENYLQMFGELRTDKGRDRYPMITYHRAPRKPFLLLSVMDLIAQGRITQNLIEPAYELVDTFNTYWVSLIQTMGAEGTFLLSCHCGRHPLEQGFLEGRMGSAKFEPRDGSIYAS